MTPDTKDTIDLIFKGTVAFAAVYGSWRSTRNAQSLEVVKEKVADVHSDVNGKMSQLLKVTKKEAFAAGVKSEAESNGET